MSNEVTFINKHLITYNKQQKFFFFLFEFDKCFQKPSRTYNTYMRTHISPLPYLPPEMY